MKKSTDRYSVNFGTDTPEHGRGLVLYSNIINKVVAIKISGFGHLAVYLAGYRRIDRSGERNYVRARVTDLNFSTVEQENVKNGLSYLFITIFPAVDKEGKWGQFFLCSGDKIR